MRLRLSAATLAALGAAVLVVVAGSASAASPATYDITTLTGKVASLYGTAGLQIRFSAFIEEEAEEEDGRPVPGAPPITPCSCSRARSTARRSLRRTFSSTRTRPGRRRTRRRSRSTRTTRTESSAAANDYVTRTWACTISGTPCSALGDGYSGTYYSNDGGATWCCASSDPQHLGTLIPGVTRLTGGQYDAGGDPAVAFDSAGHVYYAGLGFNRTSPPNTVAVNKGTFDGSGRLSWGPPTFINQTTAPSTLNDKEWIAVDSHASSPYRDRIYVTWTRFLFNAHNGSYTQSPISFVSSSDGGATFSDAEADLRQRALRPGVTARGRAGRDALRLLGGSTRLASLNSHVRREVDRRRRDLEQAARDLRRCHNSDS